MIFKIKSFRISGDLLELNKNFRSNSLQRVILNGQTFQCEILEIQIHLNTGVPQDLIQGLLFLLFYINDLFSVVQNKNNSASQFNTDLDKDGDWAYIWKTSFNPDP